MNLRKTVVRLLAALALAASVAAATLGPAGHAGPAHLYAIAPPASQGGSSPVAVVAQ
jgi:hypothetical protein